MKIRTTLVPICIGLLSIVSAPVFAADIFSDSFESKDMSATNTNGFKWSKNNRTSIVIQDPNDGPVAVYNNGVIYNIHSSTMPDDGSTRNWTAKSGTHSLRFSYPNGQNWSEQRYDLGGAYPEVWISYWMRVPANFYRENGRNNKWFDILMAPISQYSDTSVSRIEMQDWPNGSGGMNLNIQFRNGADGIFTNSNTYNNFITPVDANRWMLVVYHFKASATNSSTDGILRMYRRWKNETKFTLINELSNLNVGIGSGSVTAGRLGWASGYIMGYANAPYANDTEWLMDDFTVSNQSLLNLKLPNPPTLDSVQ